MIRENKEQLINALLSGDKKEFIRLKGQFDKWMDKNSINLNDLSDKEAIAVIATMTYINGKYCTEDREKWICYTNLSKVSTPILKAILYKMAAINGNLDQLESIHGKCPFDNLNIKREVRNDQGK